MTSEINNTASANQASNLGPIAIIGALFFIFGFITWANGALVPYLQMVCQLSEIEAVMVASAFYFAYTAMALPSAMVLERFGYKDGMAIGLFTLVIGFLMYIPAAQSQDFILFLLAQFVIGTGLTLLQTGANPYVVKVGPAESAAVRIMFMGLLNKGAGFIAPLAFTAIVLSGFEGISAQSLSALGDAEKAETIEALANGLVNPYIGLAITFLVLAALLKMSPLPELSAEDDEVDAVGDASGSEGKTSIMQFPGLILGAVTIFVYVGAEVIAGDTIGLFASNLGVANATSLTSYTMAFMLIGYALGIALIPRVINQETALKASAISGILFSFAVILSNPESTTVSSVLWGWMGVPLLPDTISFIALLGFANALVWPAVWPLALEGLGKFTAKGSALLIMGISGGALLPLVYGVLAESIDGQTAYAVMLPLYAYIAYYAFKGHKKREW
jgi:glucose/galactose transporter